MPFAGGDVDTLAAAASTGKVFRGDERRAVCVTTAWLGGVASSSGVGNVRLAVLANAAPRLLVVCMLKEGQRVHDTGEKAIQSL